MGGGEKGAGSKPSGSHAGLSLSQTNCYQSPFRRSRYGASPALSDESVPGASRGTGSQSGHASLQKGPVGERRQAGWKIRVWVAHPRESSFGPMLDTRSTSESGVEEGRALTVPNSRQHTLCLGKLWHVNHPDRSGLGQH